ncbi:tkl protein kinase [Plasmopara halstedii]|uniref:Tkl protein kinase n=1 Tax=Plasmopara halstedii TaxID=4781 RepID=A0A0N7L4R4_PLAHL|nr:tkl protein kinase [Plasmopara halstedii]CEG39403.1 tkl protein kinase [Plasmopara halstedii]|eukprot:XP_024575772.1 tkl protein kinase [Plasmopara halstedii]
MCQADVNTGMITFSNDTTTIKPNRSDENPSYIQTSSLHDDELGLAIGGGVIFLLVLCLLFYNLQRRKQRSIPVIPSEQVTVPVPPSSVLYAPEKTSFVSSSISFGSRLSCFEDKEKFEIWSTPQIQSVRLSVSTILLDELIARGNTSEIYRGSYQNQVRAIKKPFPHWIRSREHLETFFQHISIFASSSFQHPHLVTFFGVAWRSLAYVCIVMEFMAQGDLACYLQQQKLMLKQEEWTQRGFNRKKVIIASQIANALTFLHAQGLVHGAVRSRHVLLDDQLNAKLTGYQGSQVWNEKIDDVVMSVPTGRLVRTRFDALYHAPEVLRGQCTNAKTDVFAFGLLLAELDSLMPPYAYTRVQNSDNRLELIEKVAAGHVHVHFASSKRRHGDRTVQNDRQLTQAVVRLGKACVKLDAFQRPSAAQVLTELQKLLQTYIRTNT